MIQTTASLQRKIKVAADLKSLVHSMKNMAAASIGQYEKSISSLGEYYHNIELGLGECLRKVTKRNNQGGPVDIKQKSKLLKTGVLIFGSDQGLVGQFNDLVATFAMEKIDKESGSCHIWTVGERVGIHLKAKAYDIEGSFPLPSSVDKISPLVGQILLETNAHKSEHPFDQLFLIYNQRTFGSVFAPTFVRLLPIDEVWKKNLIDIQWPKKVLPEVIGDLDATLRALIREYLFVSIFRACAESLVSENASRLAAMQRADKNIEEILEKLKVSFQRLRQENIDEELFDIISGFEALSDDSNNRRLV